MIIRFSNTCAKTKDLVEMPLPAVRRDFHGKVAYLLVINYEERDKIFV